MRDTRVPSIPMRLYGGQIVRESGGLVHYIFGLSRVASRHEVLLTTPISVVHIQTRTPKILIEAHKAALAGESLPLGTPRHHRSVLNTIHAFLISMSITRVQSPP